MLPPGATLVSLIDRNAANAGDLVAYRYLDHSRSVDGEAGELTWAQFAGRLRAVAARLQQITTPGRRVAILAPQSLDYVAAMYGAVKAGTVAVPLFAPELPGHAERLHTALRDAEPTVILTTTAATPIVEEFLRDRPCPAPRRLHRSCDAVTLLRSAPTNELPGSDAADTAEKLVIVAERAAGTVRADPAPAIAAIRAAVADRHGVEVADVLLLPAGSVSRTTSGEVARRACRRQYLAGSMSGR